MQRTAFWIDVSRLEYDFAEGSTDAFLISDVSEDEAGAENLPSVSYLNERFGSEMQIPAELFHSRMTPLQTVIKYAKEQKKLSNKQIASLLGRGLRTVWITYRKVAPLRFPKVRDGTRRIPLHIFKESGVSALESLVSFLKQEGLSFADISRLVGRDQRTVWTAFDRAQRKRNRKAEVEGSKQDV